MQAGALDRPVQFRRATLHDDGLGEIEDWTDYGGPLMASKKDISDAERWRSGEVQAHVTTRFVVRWSPFTAGITPRDRLVCEGREYEISGIKETDGRRRGLEITAAVRID